MGAPATFVIKALVCISFTRQGGKMMCRRSMAAIVVAGLISLTLYGFVNVLLPRSLAAYRPQFSGTLVQGIGSGVVFLSLAPVPDRAGIRNRLHCPVL